jgi:quinol monooxygenase YgiN
MFDVIVRQRINPGAEAEFEELVRRMTADTRDRDQGCLRFEWYRSEEPSTYILVERWTSKEEAVAHLKSEHMRPIFARLREISPEPFRMDRIVPVPIPG